MGRASRVCGGGIPDWSGVQSAAGQSVYVLNGVWQKITDVWYDGYLVGKGGKASIFRAGTPTGRPGTISVMHDAQRTIVQVDPAPPRTGGATTLNGALTAVATTASLVASNFSLGKGLAMIGTEIVSYSSNIGGNLAGLVRGLGGTQIQAWPIGTAVVELNLAIAGLRLASTYAPGDASKTFSVPVGWELPIKKYLLSMFREGEQNGREAQRLMKECDMDLAMLLRANRQQAGPVQITPGGAQGPEVVGGLGGPFGGVIVP
jgi:stage V sporulation protein SpoVS